MQFTLSELTIVRRLTHNLSVYQLTVVDNLPQRTFATIIYQYSRAEVGSTRILVMGTTY